MTQQNGTMTTPRGLLIDPNTPGHYHLVSRCVRRSWLFGRWPKRDYSYRKAWLFERMMQLAPAFALEIHAYTIMSNHFHLVVYVDPEAPQHWEDDDVATRWLAICPPKRLDGEIDKIRASALKQTILADPERLRSIRGKLGSVSVFMKLLKQPIARRANLEDGFTGHFFEQRFYSATMLDDNALVAAIAYVDLNAIRAGITDSLATSQDTFIALRLKDGFGEKNRLDAADSFRTNDPKNGAHIQTDVHSISGGAIKTFDEKTETKLRHRSMALKSCNRQASAESLRRRIGSQDVDREAWVAVSGSPARLN